ncbi:hypothetical protein BC830DRAFT_1175616, partial [Chytriomyces sp. MP71]
MSPLGVFVFYNKKEDAIRAIEAVDGTVFDGNKLLRATHGTTKYCQFFLKNQPCQHAVCQYLHEPAEEADTYAKEELSRQAQRDRNPRPVPFATILSYYRKDDKEESALPATASWAKPIGVGSRAINSPIPYAMQHHQQFHNSPHISDSEYSDSEFGRPTQTVSLAEFATEKRKKNKKASNSAIAAAEKAAAAAMTAQILNGPNADKTSNAGDSNSSAASTPQPPPGLVPNRSNASSSPTPSTNPSSTATITAKPAANTTNAAASSSTSSTATGSPAAPSAVPDEDRILGSKALHDPSDEMVPNLIRRGPPNSAYAVARERALKSGMAGKGGVGMYNLGFILQPTYTGLFDPFSSDPFALVRGSGIVGGEEFAGAGRFGEEERLGQLEKRALYQGVMPHVDTDSRWMDGSKVPLQDPMQAQWPQQQQQQQLLREQILAENLLRQQQQLLRGAGPNVAAAAAAFAGAGGTGLSRQQELLLLQQQQQR